MPIPSFLGEKIEQSFGSIENLKAEFIANAKAMFGPGFIWLVVADSPSRMVKQSQLFILRTYASGSPLKGAQLKSQRAKKHIVLDADDEVTAHRIMDAGRDSGVLEVDPVLCVSTWQHSYLPDYGVAKKEEFLNQWWDRIDWDVVDQDVRHAYSSVGFDSSRPATLGSGMGSLSQRV